VRETEHASFAEMREQRAAKNNIDRVCVHVAVESAPRRAHVPPTRVRLIGATSWATGLTARSGELHIARGPDPVCASRFAQIETSKTAQGAAHALSFFLSHHFLFTILLVV